MRYSIGIDVGGTNIRIAVVDEDGNLYDVIKESTKAKTIDGLKEQILELISKIDYKKYNVCGIGIGVPGPVRPDGTVIYIPNLNISESFNLKKMIEDEIHLPTFVGNDANVAGLAEAYVGNGKGYDVVQYITMSTGIGGGLVMNKKMIIGKNGLAQEIGSMIVKNGGRAPSIFKAKGCIEGEASGTMITLKANELGLSCENAGDVFNLASQGNEIALKLKEEFISDVAAFIGSIVAYMEPDIFVIGGGLMKSKDHFFDALVKKVDDYVYESLKGNVKIVPAKYDQDCGIIGAAMQAF